MKFAPLVATMLVLAACSTQPTGADADPFAAQDPIQPFNEAIFSFNLGADSYVVKPIADTYHLLPDTIRDGFSNFLSNLHEPANFVNSTLQLDFTHAATTFSRFVLNTTVGILGVNDFAADQGLKQHNTDFGKTLGSYTVADGAYIVLPLMGPSTVRDTTGLAVDWFLDPVGWFLTTPESIAQGVSDGIVAREENAAIIDQLYYKSLEPYSATRAAYLQHQAFDWK